MRIHAIIHASFEKLGVIETWVKHKGYQLTETHTYKGQLLPTPNDFDLLIVMGGPQSPLGIDQWPYLQDEIDLIKAAIAANKAIVGVCLGAQLIGESLGAVTQRSPHKEIGMFPIELLPAAAPDPVFGKFPQTFSVMHWHNDMPGIPAQAELLAKSAGCPRQVFRYKDRVYGLQCHFEMTKENIIDMIEHCGTDLREGQYVETKQQLLSHDFTAMNAKIVALLDYLITLTH